MDQNELSHQMQGLLKQLRVAASIAGSVTAVGAAISLPVGIFFLVFYLIRVSAPIPIGESTLPTLLIVFAFTCCMSIFFLCGMAFSIVLLSISGISQVVRDALPHLRPSPILPAKLLKHHVRASLEEYTLLYTPFLLFFCADFAARSASISFDVKESAEIILSCGIVGVLLSGAVFFCNKTTGSMSVITASRLHRTAISCSIVSAEFVISTGWFIFAFYTVAKIGLATGNDRWLLVSQIMILLVHFLANVSRVGRTKTGFLVSFVGFIIWCKVFGVAVVGATALRLLGIGGGLPSDITVRYFDPGSGAAAVKDVKGCLLMATGSQIAIHPTGNQTDCALFHFLISIPDDKAAWRVEIYPQSQITEWSGF